LIFRLVWENVRQRPIRAMLSILLIAGPVTMILTLIGMSHGFVDESKKRYAGVGADILFRAPGSSQVMGFSTASLPDKFVAALLKEPHVAQATGTVVALTTGFDSITGIDVNAFNKMSGGFTFVEGHSFESPNDILLDTYEAEQLHAHVGGTINVLHQNWHVAGIVEPGKLAHQFVQLPVLQNLIGATGKLTQIYLKLDNPANTNEVMAYLRSKYDGYPVFSMKDLQTMLSVDNIPMLSTFLHVVIGIGIVFGFGVVSLSMYMAVLQRTREIGILKSLGANSLLVMELILAEAFILGLGGTIVGILLSFVSRAVMLTVAPASFPQAIVLSWWPIAGSIAMGAALLGALYPGMMAVRQDPIEALAYE
jgi:putative ABC transport system permease protein